MRFFGWFRKPKVPERTDLFYIVGMKNTCPDCGSKGFYEGPSGGMSTNIFCRNRDCRSGFNLTPFSINQGLCDCISKWDKVRYPEPKDGTVK